mmetsp:Transcript_6001/g.7324  ORF Transcript_6001/g.7324 Transcript_6001/m.7324 type:complete len:119 (-) Transcript_6001:194-550(-)
MDLTRSGRKSIARCWRRGVLKLGRRRRKFLKRLSKSSKKFYDDRSSDKSKMHSENLDEEKQKRADIAKLFETGNDWEKVCKMLSLAPDSNRKVDRFRKLLQTLKNEGTYGKSKREAKE